MKQRCVSLLIALVFCAAQAQNPDSIKTTLSQNDAGTIWFRSAKPLVIARESQDGSSTRTPGFTLLTDQSIPLSGELAFPAGQGPFPVIVLAHGCAGIGHADKAWVPLLREWGYATFVVDSFRPRGFVSICEDLRRLRPLQRLPDIYGALSVLATHPKIDANRIVLMGASHGGLLTLDAATQWAKDTFASPGGGGFRAFIAMYPYCNVSAPELNSIYAPLRIHSGELDDWTPTKPCQEYVDSLKASGQSADIEVYPNAHHAFDDPSLPLIKLPNVPSVAKCRWRGSSILESMTPEPASCISRGVTLGYSSIATDTARLNVRAQLAELLK
jgi:dienelactone hydrolase